MIHVVIAATSNYEPLAAITRPRLKAWAEHIGAQFTFVPLPGAGLETSWAKLNVILGRTTAEDTAIWADTDVLVVNPAHDPAKWLPNDGLAFSGDAWGICAGFFACQGLWARRLVETVKWLGQSVRQPVRFEQDTFKVLAENFPGVKRRFRQIPESVVSCPGSGFHKDALGFHAWTSSWGDRFDQKVQLMARLADDWTLPNLEALLR
jgi:hypothetical protein